MVWSTPFIHSDTLTTITYGIMFILHTFLLFTLFGSCVSEATTPIWSLSEVKTTAAPQPTQRSDSPVSVSTTHTNIHERFTKELTVNCSFDVAHNTEFSAVISLILAKTSTPRDSSFTEISTITQLTPYTVEVKDDLGAKVKGQLVSGKDAFITYKWLYPMTRVEGRYVCTAHGIDRLGHPISASASTVINERDVDLQMILEKLKTMELTQDSIIAENNNTVDHIARIKQNLNDSVSSAFFNATVFRGHTYIISHETLNNVPVFKGLCNACNGYLVEVSDAAEWNFLLNFRKNNDPASLYCMLGMTDEGHEGTWTNIHSGTPANYTVWASSEPDSTTDYNCAAVHPNNQMYDFVCVDTNRVRFICEVDQ